ncbi:hypothetical protein OKW23_000020 [Bacilli bacterium PM5-9]|nr:hypothetical protein [Bacilli bacterium PM5-9]
MKRNRAIAIVLILATIIMIVLIVRDITNSSFLENKGKTEKVSDNGLIAIIDSGANLNHVNYDEKLKISKYNVLNDSEDISDESKRGTLLFSALYNDIYSMNKKNDVLIIKAFKDANEIDGNNVAKALDYACNQKADIVNLSFSIPQNTLVDEAIKTCAFKGSTIVAMSDGNSEDLSYPASNNDVISVSKLNNKSKTDVKVDTSQQRVCIKNKCNPNSNVALSTIYATGYLIDYKDKNKTASNLILKPSYQINVIEK